MNRSCGMMALAASLFLSGTALAQGAPGGFSADGRIEDSDRVDDERRYDEHAIRLEAGRRYRISASSDDFDTLLRLYRAGETESVAENDDFGGSLNSRITYTPQESGNYVLRVQSFSPEGRGAYRVTSEALPPLPAVASRPPNSTVGGSWRIWDGELTASDPDRDGKHFDDYPIRMAEGETRIISAESSAFDTMIWVMRAADREGEPLEVDDDTGPGFNAVLGFQAEDGGDYIVRVTSFGDGSTGAYRLRISDPLTPPVPVPAPDVNAADD